MDVLTLNDTPGVYPRSYYAATANEVAEHPPLDGDARADVCVIGAGYCGLSAALRLAGHGFSVVLIDANRAGWGASGRNGGQLGTGQRLNQKTLEKLVGMDHARRLWEIAEHGKGLVKSLIGKHGIACDLTPGIVYADHKKRHVAGTRAHVAHLNTVYGYDRIEFLDRARLSAAIGTEIYHGGSRDMGAAHLHPLNFALGLARAARAAGVTIHDKTRALEVIEGRPARVKTATGTITADHVIYACNGYLGDLDRKVAARVMPINSYILATEPLGEDRARVLIPQNVAVADSRFVVNYYRFSADHRLLFGGRESYGYRYPADIAEAVRRRMLSIYPGLSDARVDYAWGGALGITMNRMPHFARLAPNIFSASGFSGHGVGMATEAGWLMAEAVAGTADGFEAMERVPTHPFPGGVAFRRPLLVMAMLYYALRDRL